MLKIQMLEQIVTNDNVADEQQNDPEKSPQRTPVNLSPQRNGLVNNHILILFFYLFLFFYNIYLIWTWQRLSESNCCSNFDIHLMTLSPVIMPWKYLSFQKRIEILRANVCIVHTRNPHQTNPKTYTIARVSSMSPGMSKNRARHFHQQAIKLNVVILFIFLPLQKIFHSIGHIN